MKTKLLILAAVIITGCYNSETYFLKDINFNDGDYIMVIKDKERGAYWIDDESVLKANQKGVKIKSSWLNHLPGEGDRTFGFTLLKDGKAVKGVYGAIFSAYNYGTLLQNARAFDEVAEKIRLQVTKTEFEEQQLAQLAFDKNVVNLSLPTFDKNGIEYWFHVTLPTVVVPVPKTTIVNGLEILDDPENAFDASAFGSKIRAQLEKDLAPYGEFYFDEYTSDLLQATIKGAYVTNESGAYAEGLNKQTVVAQDWQLLEYSFNVSAEKAFYDKAKQHNFLNYIPHNFRSLDLTIEALSDQLAADGSYSLEGFNPEVKISNFNTRDYQVSYWKLK